MQPTNPSVSFLTDKYEACFYTLAFTGILSNMEVILLSYDFLHCRA